MHFLSHKCQQPNKVAIFKPIWAISSGPMQKFARRKKWKRLKMVLKGPKIAKKGKKGLRKVQKYHETVKIGPKFAQ